MSLKLFGKKVALVPHGTHQYAKDWTSVFKKTCTELGGEIVDENSVDYNKESDFSPAVTKAFRRKTGCFVCRWGFPTDSPRH
jgi:branched-chain amino acid transport system substrate-binding protein